MRSAVAALAALLVATGAVAGPDPSASLGLVHVEANVGSASGGHLALLLGDLLYNFQVEVGSGAGEVDDGLLVLVRERWDPARLRYGTLENRPLHVAHVPLAPPQRARVRDHFDRLHLAQQRAFDEARTAAADLAHLAALAGGGDGVALRGAGLLDPTRPGAAAGERLRGRIARRLGPDFLASARERARAAREALVVIGADGRVVPGSLRRTRELLTEEVALRALDEGWDLAPGAWIRDPEPWALAPAARARLEAFAASLDEDVLALLASPRPDRGFPLLLATARRLAVARSLTEGRLVLLDPLPDVPPTVPAEAVATRREELAAAVAVAARAWAHERDARLAAPLDEIAWNRLEEGAARTRELRRGLTQGTGLRLVGRGPRVPARARRVPVAAPPPPSAALSGALDEARARRDGLRAALARRYGYDLISDNCVHALAEGLAEALGGEDALRAVLGVDRDPDAALGFIPAVFFARAAATLPEARVERLPPYRERALAALYTRGRPAAVYARESNRLTSRIYRHRDVDGSFLLFTSDVVWPRPLYGVANLLWAVGDGALGLVTAPFDRGARVSRAAKGAFFSAPELVFLNIRKGSFDAATLVSGASPAR